MAPEQWRAEEVGPRSDLFSCGAILYELMSGKRAFPGSNPIDVFHACAYEQPAPLSGTPGIGSIDRVIHRSIAKDPNERPASAAAMAEELREAMERLRMLESGGGRDTPLSLRRVETVQRFVALPFRMLRPDPEVDFLSTSLPGGDRILAGGNSAPGGAVHPGRGVRRWSRAGPQEARVRGRGRLRVGRESHVGRLAATSQRRAARGAIRHSSVVAQGRCRDR